MTSPLRSVLTAALLAAAGLGGAGAALQVTPGTVLGPDSYSQAAYEGESFHFEPSSGEFGGPGHGGVQSWATPFGTHSHLAQGGTLLSSSSSWLMDRDAHRDTAWVRARGGSAAYATDRIRVTLPTQLGLAQHGSILQFNWKIDGQLAAQINSYSAFELGVRNGWEWGYFADVEAWFQYRDVTGQSPRTVLFERDIQRTGGVAVDNQQEWFQTFLRDDQVFNNRIVPGGVFEWKADNVPVDRSGVSNNLVLIAPGTDVELFFGLATGYNALFRLVDTDPDLASFVESAFGHTMELVSVQLFNPDGTPYIGSWTLESRAGLDYPEMIVQAGALPLPGSLAMALTALVALVAPAATRSARRRIMYPLLRR